LEAEAVEAEAISVEAEAIDEIAASTPWLEIILSKIFPNGTISGDPIGRKANCVQRCWRFVSACDVP